MSEISSAVILTHPRAQGLQGYAISLVAEEWRARGIQVTEHKDISASIAADLCVVHVDLSVVPPPYAEFARRFRHTINLGITDIRKRTYSRNRVVRGDGFEGPVIVKSSLNSAGGPEQLGKRLRLRRLWGRFHRGLTRRVPPGMPFQQPSIASKRHYRVFPRRDMLPIGWLEREDIVVERFRPERHCDQFVLREWYFLGDSEHCRCEISKDPVFTTGTDCPELAAPPPEAIRQIRKDLRIDYGKIDYAIDSDGVPVLFDVNKTIGLGDRNSPAWRAIGARLAEGLNSCLVLPRTQLAE